MARKKDIDPLPSKVVRVISIATVVLFGLWIATSVERSQAKIRLKEIEIKTVTSQVKDLNLEVDKARQERDAALEDKGSTSEQLKITEQKVLEAEQKRKELEAQLQAKLDAQKKNTAYASAERIVGSKQDWLVASGIPQSQWSYVDYIISHESGWDPNAVNKSSGACGLGQQLPCGKWSHKWNDPVGGLIDANTYALSRYGSWARAYSYWQSHGNW